MGRNLSWNCKTWSGSALELHNPIFRYNCNPNSRQAGLLLGSVARCWPLARSGLTSNAQSAAISYAPALVSASFKYASSSSSSKEARYFICLINRIPSRITVSFCQVIPLPLKNALDTLCVFLSILIHYYYYRGQVTRLVLCERLSRSHSSTAKRSLRPQTSGAPIQDYQCPPNAPRRQRFL